MPRRKAPSVLQIDGFFNSVSGFGTRADKQYYTDFAIPFVLQPQQCSNLYHFDDICEKIVAFRPREMFRAGYELESDDHDVVNEMDKKAKKLGLDAAVLNATIWGRCYGGCLLILGVDDGMAVDQPLNEEKVRDLKYLTVLDRRYAQPSLWYDNPLEPKYGQVAVYDIMSADGKVSGSIHESRTIRFGGAHTDERVRRSLNSWDLSVLQRPYDTIKKFAAAYENLGLMLYDASQGVLKIKDLYQALASDGAIVQKRLQLTDMTRSSSRSVVVDAEHEDFKKESTSFAGSGDVIDRFQQRLAAASDIPVAILMGRSAAGQNATGEMDLRTFYATVSSDQENILKPILERLYGMIAKSLGKEIEIEIEICFNELQQLSALEQQELENKRAQTDKVYVDMGALFPEEVTLNRWGRGEFYANTVLSEEAIAAREQSLNHELTIAKDPTVMENQLLQAQGAVVNGEDSGSGGKPDENKPESPSGGGTASRQNY